MNPCAYTYDMDDPQIARDITRSRLLQQEFNNAPADDYAGKEAIIRRLFGSAGKDLTVQQRFTCDMGKNIHVGDHFFANYNCTILDMAEVHIGDNCLMAPNAAIYTASHPIQAAGRAAKVGYATPVTIGNNVWIGAGAMILPGVVVGDGVVVAAGAVVTRDVPPNTVVAGSPARVIKEIDQTQPWP